MLGVLSYELGYSRDQLSCFRAETLEIRLNPALCVLQTYFRISLSLLHFQRLSITISKAQFYSIVLMTLLLEGCNKDLDKDSKGS